MIIINLGLVCMRKGRGFKKGFVGKTAVQSADKSIKRKKLLKASLYNLHETISNIEYCINNNIYNYRISSNIIPFDDFWEWQSEPQILALMKKISQYDISLTIHPSQYTVLNSNNPSVVSNSIDILSHHYNLCKLMGIQHIILHTGGIYGDKKASMLRFVENYNKLPTKIQQLIRLENCHYYDIDDIISINSLCNVDICFDLHHERVINGTQTLQQYVDKLTTVDDINNNQTVCHISSGKSTTHDNYISNDDMQLFQQVFDGFNCIVEVEAKYKDLAIEKIQKRI